MASASSLKTSAFSEAAGLTRLAVAMPRYTSILA
jgi:hypothetical protein